MKKKTRFFSIFSKKSDDSCSGRETVLFFLSLEAFYRFKAGESIERSSEEDYIFSFRYSCIGVEEGSIIIRKEGFFMSDDKKTYVDRTEKFLFREETMFV